MVRPGDVVTGRFAPWSFMRTAVVRSVDGDQVEVETMDGEKHMRRRWSLRVHRRNAQQEGAPW